MILETPALRYSTLDTPIGKLLLVADETGLRAIDFARAKASPGWRRDDAALGEARRQLAAYFAGDLREFALALNPQGTPFQRRVWALLETIPYGATTTYGALARRLGTPSGARAVGSANARNPIPIIVPCHRVIGGDGSLTGYAGGLSIKRRLLEIEAGGALLKWR